MTCKGQSMTCTIWCLHPDCQPSRLLRRTSQTGRTDTDAVQAAAQTSVCSAISGLKRLVISGHGSPSDVKRKRHGAACRSAPRLPVKRVKLPAFLIPPLLRGRGVQPSPDGSGKAHQDACVRVHPGTRDLVASLPSEHDNVRPSAR